MIGLLVVFRFQQVRVIASHDRHFSKVFIGSDNCWRSLAMTDTLIKSSINSYLVLLILLVTLSRDQDFSEVYIDSIIIIIFLSIPSNIGYR